MSFIWHTIFYDPILNALVALYNGIAKQNLGVALIELTVMLRIFLLPLTVISWRARSRYDALRRETLNLEQTYKNDHIRRKEAIRGLLHRHNINPWAKAGVMGVQFMALIVIYRVFVDAVRHNNFSGLYSWNEAPDFLNRTFLGFDLSAHSFFWAAIVGVLLYFDMWFEQRKRRDTLTRGDIIYSGAFPLASFLLLYALPAGKSVFVLTSILFTIMIEVVRKLFVHAPPPPPVVEEEEDNAGELVE